MHNFLKINIQHFIDKQQGNIKRFHTFTQTYCLVYSLVQVIRWPICHAGMVKVGEKKQFHINMYLLTRTVHARTKEYTGLLSQQTCTTLKLSPKFFFFLPNNSFFLCVNAFPFHLPPFHPKHNYTGDLASLDLHLFLWKEFMQDW